MRGSARFEPRCSPHESGALSIDLSPTVVVCFGFVLVAWFVHGGRIIYVRTVYGGRTKYVRTVFVGVR